MKVLLTRLAAFVGRHWLRVGLIGCALVLLSQKQVNFNIRLGHPGGGGAPVEHVPELNHPAREAVAEEEVLLLSADKSEESRGFFSRFNFFGGGEEAPSRADRLDRIGEAQVLSFLDRFSHVAQAEQQKFGIPASIVLGTALLYSEAGNSRVAEADNSYFGLGCTDSWDGVRVNDSNGRCLRSYATAWTGFRDFSLTVTSGRFAPMRQFDERDYRRWARGLQELGLNEDAALAEELTSVIERYELFRYD